MFDRIFLWFNRLSPSSIAAFTGIFTILAFYIGAVMENRVQRIWGEKPEDQAWGAFWLLFVLIVAALLGILHYKYRRFLEINKDESKRHIRAIEDARERVTNLNGKHLTLCDAMIEKETVLPVDFRSVLICEVQRINELIEAAWEVINSNHNVSNIATERVNFELTLITYSIRDSKLTIPAWRNRDDRRPKSLLMREQGDVDIYNRTEAAKMISNRITDTRIIKDTSEPLENYDALYDDQKVRIRSSVLFPVLSPKSVHLGVIVLHCEKPGFFRVEDRRYWHELFSVFAPSIALELERINAFNKICSTSTTFPIEKYEPY